ncbi:MAG: hypothetical protein KDB03_24515 [Planctomycetales bacterium]|nr:hypothetical protein [Planctomycetales bacterium]
MNSRSNTTWNRLLIKSWQIGQIRIHFSLLLIVAVFSLGILILASTQPGMMELRTAALTLPVVWLGSLIVRTAAQQLCLGVHAQDCETLLGPCGNLSTDYEFLPWSSNVRYTLVGQGASAALAGVGLLISAVLAPEENSSLATILDFQAGFESRAWATQIMWMNAFFFVLHLFPAVPFDTRALCYGLLVRLPQANIQVTPYRTLSALQSHLAAVLMGAGVVLASLGVGVGLDFAGWYASFAAAFYLFVGSRWEDSRAKELESHYQIQSWQSDVVHSTVAAPAARSQANQLVERAEAAAEEMLGTGNYVERMDEFLDVDEILRKLHREGKAALSAAENAVLIDASRRMKARQRKKTN